MFVTMPTFAIAAWDAMESPTVMARAIALINTDNATHSVMIARHYCISSWPGYITCVDEQLRRLERQAVHDLEAKEKLLRLRQRLEPEAQPKPWVHSNCHCFPPCDFVVMISTVKCTCGEDFEARCTLTDRQCDESCELVTRYRIYQAARLDQ